MSKKLGSFIVLALIALFAFWGYKYVSFREKNAVSDAAFIKSDKISFLGFKVGGKVTQIYFKENGYVKKGELLAKIDPKDFLIAKDKIINQIEALSKKIQLLKNRKERVKKTLQLKTSISKMDEKSIDSKIKSLKFKIEALKAKEEKAKKDTLRFKKLLEKRLIAKSDFENVKTNLKVLQKEIDSIKENLNSLFIAKKKAKKAYLLSKTTQEETKEIQKEIEALQKRKEVLKDSLKDIENKISYTNLYAPFDGIIAKKFLSPPKIIKKGSPVCALVDLESLYCEVLLSEKKLRGVKVGNKVSIEVDALDKKYKGIVESIAPTSASTFSLVPRDIASGEFTKLDQRFAVRIKLQNKKDLRAGMSATVAIERR